MPELFNPQSPDFTSFDTTTQSLFQVTIDFFETRGKTWLKQQDRDRVWYGEFLDMVKQQRIFAIFLTPSAEADGDPDKRWDTARIAMYSQILGFYGMQYWYVWQVSILGLGPIWQSSNAAARRRAAKALEAGEIFAFGLSERDHGADVYSTDMVLTPQPGGGYLANGAKHYIGNGNEAAMVSVFGRRSDKPIIDSSDVDNYRPDADFDGYVFFAADSRHDSYTRVTNVVDAQMYVAAFDLDDYPVVAEDILHEGKAAFHAAINTVNVGKFNLGFGAIGACEHALYEALTHADNRILFGQRVTQFPQIRRMTAEAYARLIAMKLYSARAIDYMRSASQDDRRYLLFNAVEKMTVTREGEKIIMLLADTIAARAFESDMYFNMALLGVTGLPRLEGTVHVNMALSLKFMQNYMFRPNDIGLVALRALPLTHSPNAAVLAAAKVARRTGAALTPALSRVPLTPIRDALTDTSLPEIPTRDDHADDEFLFAQGASAGLSKVQFADWHPVLQEFSHLPNVAVFLEQADALQALLAAAAPNPEQQRDVDFLFAIGELFTLVPYAQLILEQARTDQTDPGIIDHIFETLVTDFSTHATRLHCKPTATALQKNLARTLLRTPVADTARFDDVVQRARALANVYELKP